jgi:hypothetical protein
VHAGSGRSTYDQRHFGSPSVVNLGGHIDDLVEAASCEVHELDGPC